MATSRQFAALFIAVNFVQAPALAQDKGVSGPEFARMPRLAAGPWMLEYRVDTYMRLNEGQVRDKIADAIRQTRDDIQAKVYPQTRR